MASTIRLEDSGAGSVCKVVTRMVTESRVTLADGEDSGSEMDVFVETGEVGTEVLVAEDAAVVVVSVTEADDMSTCSGWGVDDCWRAFGGRIGKGKGRSRAFRLTSSGGRARGEIMIPGALEGSVGRPDQITYSGALTGTTEDNVAAGEV